MTRSPLKSITASENNQNIPENFTDNTAKSNNNNNNPTLRQKLKKCLLSNQTEDIHQIICSPSDQEPLIIEIMTNMVEALQNEVFINFCNYCKNGDEYILAFCNFISAMPLGADNGFIKTTKVTSSFVGFRRLIFYLGQALFQSMAETEVVENNDQEDERLENNDNDEQNIELAILTFFEQINTAKLTELLTNSMPFILLKLVQKIENLDTKSRQYSKWLNKLYSFRKCFSMIDWEELTNSNSAEDLIPENPNKMTLKHVISLATFNLQSSLVTICLDDNLITNALGSEIISRILISVDSESRKTICELITKNIAISDKKTGMEYGVVCFKAVKYVCENIRRMNECLKGKEKGKEKDKDNHNRVLTLSQKQMYQNSKQKYEAIKNELEEYLIQEIMDLACYSSKQNIFQEYFEFIQVLYKHRKEASDGKNGSINLICYNLWKGIIFSALESENMNVRYNSIRLFHEVYPIADDSLPSNELQQIMQLQHDTLAKLMVDECPLIRVKALETVTSVLTTVWDTMLPAVIIQFLKIWILRLTFDSSSVVVRTNAYNCLARLIKNQDLSHPLLEGLISTISHGIHDANDKVRSAFMNVLLEIKETKIPFTNIISLKMLMACIQTEKDTKICVKMVKMLADICFKKEESGEKRLNRLNLSMTNNFEATRIVFYYVSNQKYIESVYPTLETPIESLAELAVQIGNMITANLKQAKDRYDKKIERSSTQNETQNQSSIEKIEFMSAKQLDTVINFFEIGSIIYTNIVSKCDKETSINLMSSYKNLIHAIARLIDDPRAARTALFVSNKLPAKAVEHISSVAMKRLEDADENVPEDFYGPFIKCVVSWQWIRKLTEMLCTWFENTLKSDEESKKKNSNSAKAKGKKGIRFDVPEDPPKPILALNYTSYMLESTFINKEVCSTNIFFDLRDNLQPILSILKKRLKVRDNDNDNQSFKHNEILTSHKKGDILMIQYYRLLLRLFLFTDLSLSDGDYQTKSRRQSITPRKERTDLHQNSNFEGCQMALKFINNVVIKHADLVKLNADSASNSNSPNTKFYKNLIKITLEFYKNIINCNQVKVNQVLIKNIFESLTVFWDLELTCNDFEDLAQIILALELADDGLKFNQEIIEEMVDKICNDGENSRSYLKIKTSALILHHLDENLLKKLVQSTLKAINLDYFETDQDQNFSDTEINEEKANVEYKFSFKNITAKNVVERVLANYPDLDLLKNVIINEKNEENLDIVRGLVFLIRNSSKKSEKFDGLVLELKFKDLLKFFVVE